MSTVIFKHGPPLPCVWSHRSMEFTCCVECFNGVDTKYCDGTEVPVWKLCAMHQGLADSGTLNYDKDMLKFLRKSIYEEKITKPEPKYEEPKVDSPPSSPWTTSSKRSSGSSVDVEIELIREQQARNRKHLATYNQYRKTYLRPIESPFILWPHMSWVHSHAKTCYHKPDALLSTRVIGTVPPTIKLITTPLAMAKLNAQRTEFLLARRKDFDTELALGHRSKYWERAIAEMEEELSASNLGKGIFFRRCNGLWMNVFGWVWDDEFEEEAEITDESSASGKFAQLSINEITDENNVNNGNDDPLTHVGKNKCPAHRSKANGNSNHLESTKTNNQPIEIPPIQIPPIPKQPHYQPDITAHHPNETGISANCLMGRERIAASLPACLDSLSNSCYQRNRVYIKEAKAERERLIEIERNRRLTAEIERREEESMRKWEKFLR